MTNESAIEVLREIWRYKDSKIYTDGHIREALVMAINALENKDETCETCRHKEDRVYDAFRKCEVPCDFCTRSEKGRIDMYVK